MLDAEEAKAGTTLTVEDMLVNGFGASPRFPGPARRIGSPHARLRAVFPQLPHRARGAREEVVVTLSLQPDALRRLAGQAPADSREV
jgi:hypothetical protein